MTAMGTHSKPLNGTVTNGALVPFRFPPGPVSGWPQDDPGQPRTPPDRAGRRRRLRYPWPLMLIAAPAAVAVWSGWVGLGGMCGFGPVRLLPGIADGFTVNTAITLPVGVEAYGAYALYVWLAGKVSAKTRAFARNSAFAALGLGCLGQVVYHLLAAARWAEAPWGVVVAVSCLPVVTLSFAAALVHMTLADARGDTAAATSAVTPAAVVPAVTPASDKPVQARPGLSARPAPSRGDRQMSKIDRARAVLADSPGLSNREVAAMVAAEMGNCDVRTVKRARNGTAKT